MFNRGPSFDEGAKPSSRQDAWYKHTTIVGPPQSDDDKHCQSAKNALN